jgi:hypothetical protein
MHTCKKLVLLSCLALGGCHHRYHKAKIDVSHLPDKTWVYSDNHGDWYIYTADGGGTSSAVRSDRYTSGGYWRPTTAPSAATQRASQKEEEEVEEDTEGEPAESAMDAEEATTESESGDAADSAGGGDAGGGGSGGDGGGGGGE